MESMSDGNTVKLASIRPHLDAKQLALAEDNLRRFLALVVRVFERRRLEAEHSRALGADSVARENDLRDQV